MAQGRLRPRNRSPCLIRHVASSTTQDACRDIGIIWPVRKSKVMPRLASGRGSDAIVVSNRIAGFCMTLIFFWTRFRLCYRLDAEELKRGSPHQQ